MDTPSKEPFQSLVDIPHWGLREKINREQNASVAWQGHTRLIRMLCSHDLFAYGLYEGRFYAINGMAQRKGTKIYVKEGRFEVSDDPPIELRMATDLIEICVP